MPDGCQCGGQTVAIPWHRTPSSLVKHGTSLPAERRQHGLVLRKVAEQLREGVPGQRLRIDSRQSLTEDRQAQSISLSVDSVRQT